MAESWLSYPNRRAFAAAIIAVASIHPAFGMQLISEDEARLPAAPKAASRGGITRGPSINVVSPDAKAQIKPPFAMTVQFRPHGGTKIDPASVKVTYLKQPLVDLTPRVKPAISESGIKLDRVDVPAGTHDIRIEVTDADGRTKSEVVTFTAVK